MKTSNQHNIPTKKYTLKATYKDLRVIFGQQLLAFTQQFLASNPDLDVFFTDVDNNQEWLEQKISEWCELEEPTIAQDLDTTTAIFLLAIVNKLDELTDDDSNVDSDSDSDQESEDTSPFA